MLLLTTDKDKSVQKAALSNFSEVLQNEQVQTKIVKHLPHVSDVRITLVIF